MNNRLAQGRPDLFRKEFSRILRGMIWVAAPVSIVSYFIRGYLARLIFSQNSPQIAIIFGFLTLSIFATTLYTLISRWFYSQKDTITPLLVSVFAVLLDITLVNILARPSTYGMSGLAITQSIVAASEVTVLGIIMIIRDRKLFDYDFVRAIGRIMSVTGFSAAAGFIMVQFLPLGISDRGIVTLGGKLALIFGVVAVVHLTMSALFGLDEAKAVFKRLRQIILQPIKEQF
jgi:peptidoglycan biosynthesis protein MviN/MurJ (putative lipid II flippase)